MCQTPGLPANFFHHSPRTVSEKPISSVPKQMQLSRIKLLFSVFYIFVLSPIDGS